MLMNILSNLIVIIIPYSQIWALKTQWQIEGKKKKSEIIPFIQESVNVV